jgi:hypothetical protein
MMMGIVVAGSELIPWMGSGQFAELDGSPAALFQRDPKQCTVYMISELASNTVCFVSPRLQGWILRMLEKKTSMFCISDLVGEDIIPPTK